MDRRRFVAALAALPALGAATLAAAPRPRRRLLCFTKSSGWQHTVVTRGPGGAPSLVERSVAALGARAGFDVTCTKDGGVFTPAGLRPFTAVVLYTTGDLAAPGTDGQPPMPAGGKQALLDAVRGGLGVVGVHAASDTFHSPPNGPPDPYIAMLGGEFLAHGAQQAARTRAADPAFPGMAPFADGAPRMGEWYSLVHFAPDLHVLQVLETAGMAGAEYQRAPYPVTWTRRHGRGRVFYTAMGHREDEWADPAFLGLLGAAVRFAAGDGDPATPPNLDAAAPGYAERPPLPPPA